ncbi:hypothetical protein IKF76_01515 [Candidatus Saccharibacteria bacterium]|nr:hypothetical protein [Candidatus Saccharibacteria bacterium]
MTDFIENPGKTMASPAKAIGNLLQKQISENPNFYLFSPDETTSNKLDAVYDVSSRLWNLPIANWDLPESASGQIVELLSENILLAMMVGHVLSGEPAMLASYESFLTIMTSQLLQHLKFLEQSSQVAWRPDYPALNLLSTSTCWRQDHNGFSHQSPMLISTLLERPGSFVNCLFPIDDIAAGAAFDYMLSTTNVVNLTTFNKTNEPRWIDSAHAKFQLENGGASVFDFISDDEPDIVFTAAGDIVSRETIYAIKILKADIPEIKCRFVGIAALTHDAIGTTKKQLSPEIFEQYFTADKPIVANFHGYADTLKNILGNYTNLARLDVHGFAEHGSTTTPFEMLSLNSASRYHLCISVAEKLGRQDLAGKYQEILDKNTAYAQEAGQDLPEIVDFML